MRISYVRWYTPQEKMPEANEIVIIKCNFLNEPTFGYYSEGFWVLSEEQLSNEFKNFPLEIQVEEWAAMPW